MPKQQSKTAGFAVSVNDQRTIEENARDRFDEDDSFREESIDTGVMNSDGEITEKGFRELNEDIERFEKNALSWLRKNFKGAQDQGHDGNDDLVGNLTWSPRSKKQRELLELGQSERIDAVDSSFGDFADTAYDGLTEFGEVVLGGSITFFDTGLED